MPKPRGREHTSLTETAQLVVRELEKLPGIKMIAPGEIRSIRRRRSGARHCTAIFTTAGLELLISGQSVQRISIHTEHPQLIFNQLLSAKSLHAFTFKARERKPGI